MKKKGFNFITCFAILMMNCEENNNASNVVSNCGLETTFIKDIDNIDELGNATAVSYTHLTLTTTPYV